MVEVITNSAHVPDELPLLASERYLKSESGNYGWFINSRFLLPFYIKKHGVFRHLVFPMQTLHLDPGTSIGQEQEFLSDVIVEARKTKADFIGQPKTTALFDTYPPGSIHINWGAYVVDLSKSENELFSGLHSHHRRLVRKASRDGVMITRSHRSINECHDLIRSTMARQRRPTLSLEQLGNYRDNLDEHVSFYLAKLDGVNQACAVLLSDSSSAYYIIGGSCLRPHNGAATLLHWTAMQDMKKEGVRTYNFVGGRINPVKDSKQESIQVFKSRFGAQFQNGYFWKYPLNPWKYNLYQYWLRIKELTKGYKYYEDIIDNEVRTAHLDRSTSIKH